MRREIAMNAGMWGGKLPGGAAPPGTGTMLNRAPPSLTVWYNSVGPVRQTPLSPNSGFDALYAAAGTPPAPAPAIPGDGAMH